MGFSIDRSGHWLLRSLVAGTYDGESDALAYARRHSQRLRFLVVDATPLVYSIVSRTCAEAGVAEAGVAEASLANLDELVRACIAAVVEEIRRVAALLDGDDERVIFCWDGAYVAQTKLDTITRDRMRDRIIHAESYRREASHKDRRPRIEELRRHAAAAVMQRLVDRLYSSGGVDELFVQHLLQHALCEEEMLENALAIDERTKTVLHIVARDEADCLIARLCPRLQGSGESAVLSPDADLLVHSLAAPQLSYRWVVRPLPVTRKQRRQRSALPPPAFHRHHLYDRQQLLAIAPLVLASVALGMTDYGNGLPGVGARALLGKDDWLPGLAAAVKPGLVSRAWADMAASAESVQAQTHRLIQRVAALDSKKKHSAIDVARVCSIANVYILSTHAATETVPRPSFSEGPGHGWRNTLGFFANKRFMRCTPKNGAAERTPFVPTLDASPRLRKQLGGRQTAVGRTYLVPVEDAAAMPIGAPREGPNWDLLPRKKPRSVKPARHRPSQSERAAQRAARQDEEPLVVRKKTGSTPGAAAKEKLVGIFGIATVRSTSADLDSTYVGMASTVVVAGQYLSVAVQSTLRELLLLEPTFLACEDIDLDARLRTLCRVCRSASPLRTRRPDSAALSAELSALSAEERGLVRLKGVTIPMLLARRATADRMSLPPAALADEHCISSTAHSIVSACCVSSPAPPASRR
jgi:hypothetical protein